jgi:ParB family chromosome partitioning protein
MIPAIVRDVDRFTQAQMALVENIQREDLNPMDRARAYQALMSQLGLTQSELAGRLGEERSGIANYLRLLELAPPVQAMVADGSISVGHAKVLAGVSDRAEQERYAQLVLAQGLSVRNLERAVESTNIPPAAATPPPPATGSAAHLPDLEQALTRQLGLRVQVRAGRIKGRGRLILHYATLDEFDDLMKRMGVRIDD